MATFHRPSTASSGLSDDLAAGSSCRSSDLAPAAGTSSISGFKTPSFVMPSARHFRSMKPRRVQPQAYVQIETPETSDSERELDEAVDLAFEDSGIDTTSPRPHQTTSHEEKLVFKRPTAQYLHELARDLRIPATCCVCKCLGKPDKLLICSGCRRKVFHQECWDEWPDHKPDADPMIECSKTDYERFILVHTLLNSSSTPEEKDNQHIQDIWATWFGVPYDQLPRRYPQMHVYPRLQKLLRESDFSGAQQFPSLVSFIGDTSSGKSTLIRALIRNAAPGSTKYQVPVPGSLSERHTSTSGDVHLYTDPTTLSTGVPLFYADCEGFRGADLPYATRVSSMSMRRQSGHHWTPHRQDFHRTLSNADQRLRQTIAQHRNTRRSALNLKWAELSRPRAASPRRTWGPCPPEPPSTQGESTHVTSESRSLIVRELYPRLLYTFSDVVCWVSNNASTAEADIQNLFQWASSGHEYTLNQRIRPGLIIIINKDSTEVNTKWLNPDYATKNLLSYFEKSNAFKEQCDKWKRRGKDIKNVEELILCYYDSFRVVCIPRFAGHTAQSISIQYETLYREIRRSSAHIRLKRSDVGMNLDVASFNLYVEHAFHRLAKDLHSSFDFYYLTKRSLEIPSGFSEHLTSVLAKLQTDLACNDPKEEQNLLFTVVPYIASCIALQISDHEEHEIHERIQKYLEECRKALEIYRVNYWRCEATDASGTYRCRNFLEGHEKGHQFWESNPEMQQTDLQQRGPTLRVGRFQCSFDPKYMLEALETDIHAALRDGPGPRMLFWQANDCGISRYSSIRTCLTCLSNCPTHVLPCIAPNGLQHTICESCIARFQTPNGRSSAAVSLSRCPFGCQLKVSPWRIKLKPKQAGIRTLTLDGGGIRGIIELVMLEELLIEVGHGIPIQELFDLAIGTSTGGIIALSLFKQNWSVTLARHRFHYLATTAFSRRDLLETPVFRNAARLFCSYLYKSEGIERALTNAFGRGPLFGQRGARAEDKVKVGVVACIEGDRKPYLFANYNRNTTEGDGFRREENPKDEIKTWEAARASSAAPIYFRPFYHRRTRREYVDGALLRNNPISVADQETRLIWANEKHSPDIFLSLGTGVKVTEFGQATGPNPTKGKFLEKAIPAGIRRKVAVGYDMIVSTLDCEKQWSDFVSSKRSDQRSDRHCHRLNLGLDMKPPKLDDVKSMEELESLTREYFSDDPKAAPAYLNPIYATGRDHLRAIARRLLAVLFYFEESPPSSISSPIRPTASTQSLNMSHHRVTGTIWCRLSPAMTQQFESLIRSGLKFRVRQGRHTQAITHVNPRPPHFNLQNFSSKVEFLVSPHRGQQVIEVLLSGRNGVWEAISGY